MEKSNTKVLKNDPKFAFLMLQISAAVIALLFAVCSRAVGGGFYTAVKGWYESNFGENTSVEQVLTSAGSNGLLSSLAISARADSGTFFLPLSGEITAGFGYRIHPIYGNEQFHRGIDIAGDSGDEIFSTLGGVVSDIGFGKSYGNYVVIKHSENLTSLYAHCDTVLVEEGQEVSRGQRIAGVGSTGDSTGPHLHFEICINGEPVDPQWLLDKV